MNKKSYIDIDVFFFLIVTKIHTERDILQLENQLVSAEIA